MTGAGRGTRDERRLRSEAWWNDPANPGMTALYLERFLNRASPPPSCRGDDR